jgi:succinoglycan biosynthesis transport protein ExoP
MDLLTIYRLLKRKIWILVVFPLVSVVCTAFLVSRMDKVYKSTAQIATGLTTDDAVKLNEGSGNPFEINTNFTNIIESMNSIPVMSLVSYRLILHDLDPANKPFRQFKQPDKSPDVLVDQNVLSKAKDLFEDRYKRMATLNSIDPDDRMLQVVLKGFEYDYESLKKKFRIQRLSASDFISVDFFSEDPVLSALGVNLLCEEFIQYNKALKIDRSSESIEFLEALVREKKKILDQKTEQLNQFKVENNVFNYSAESQSKISMIADYELNKETEEKKLKSIELALNSVNNKIAEHQKLQQSQKEIIQVNQRIIDLRKQIADLTALNAEANRVKINQLRDELQFEVSRLETLNGGGTLEDLKALEKERDQLKLDREISMSNLASIQQSLYKLKYDVSGFASKEAKLADLEREVLFASEEYTSVQDKYNAAKNKALVIGSSIRQILKGQPSYEPEPSKAILFILLAGVGSFAFCVAVILLVEFMDLRIRVAQRLERFTRLRNIGSVNWINRKDFNLERIFSEKNTDKESQMFIQFLRKLRYELEISKGKIFLVTSTKVNVGKSFIIVCLSYTLSLINKKILIIDTNFRHNSLTHMLLPKTGEVRLIKRGAFDDVNVSGEANPGHKSMVTAKDINGKGTYANEKETFDAEQEDDSLRKSIIYNTGFKGIDIIGNIGGHDSPSEILANRDFRNVIASLSERYDYIFMEGPSLNEYSDTKELIDYADKIIAVFGAETTIDSLDTESIQFLKSVKDKFLGTILNKVEFKDLAA